MTFGWMTAVVGLGGGAVIMARSIQISNRVATLVGNGPYRRVWGTLRLFMLVFIVGYVAALTMVLAGYLRWLELIVGVIFFLGAVFVFLIMRAAHNNLATVLSGNRVQASETPRRPSAPVSMVVPAVTSGRVVVVDDDPLNRAVLEQLLVGLGHEVKLFERAEPALEALEADPEVDVVLLDLILPGLDGFDTLAQLQQHDTLSEIPVVVISALSETEQIAQCIEGGAVDYLSKPFNPVLLRARLDSCLARRRFRSAERRSRRQLENARKRADDLLRVLLPDEIAVELTETATVLPRLHNHVAVLFADIVGFTRFSEQREPEEILELLQTVIAEWEDMAQTHGVQKIKTIGDAFMGACGLRNTKFHPVTACITMGLAMIKSRHLAEVGLQLRVGVHVGPVVAGIVGQQQFQYDIWGDTVNTAARVEENGIVNRVCISKQVFEELDKRYRGIKMDPINVKGKGMMDLYYVEH